MTSRERFLAYWCEDVPENLREKWKHGVDESLREGNATSQLVSAWDAWQAAERQALERALSNVQHSRTIYEAETYLRGLIEQSASKEKKG